ncbi:TPA: hypothetical protein NHV36_004674 [Klebsiella michiganensis]|nr:hypothetical protein [Klebsiella michiganensis]HCE8859448.1 hypothetical protein [Klebsiella michiganensis]HCE9045692.1 hypothetical protein [Klebsiella michiganensis]HCE9080139.1 hypothetical protein [Klebsiella michiganensis]
MSKSLNARCIRRWEVEFKGRCDSKYSPYWRKRDLRAYIREAALTTAFCMIERIAEDNARIDFGITGWSPEFSSWYDEQREHFQKAARIILDAFASNEAIDEEIENELEAWND